MFYLVLSLITIFPMYKNSLGVEKDGDKLILKPVELIDLVIQEQMRKDSPAIRRRFKENIKSSTTENVEVDAEPGASETFEQTIHMQNLNIPARAFMPMLEMGELNPNLNSLWSYRPAPVQSKHPGEFVGRKISIKVPHSVTKLVKSLSLGYQPHFDKDLFEPLRKKQRPMALVSFRKNGIVPKVETETSTIQDNNVAELQSPYNEISSFWQDEPGMQNF